MFESLPKAPGIIKEQVFQHILDLLLFEGYHRGPEAGFWLERGHSRWTGSNYSVIHRRAKFIRTTQQRRMNIWLVSDFNLASV